jgi:hypothetical protein
MAIIVNRVSIWWRSYRQLDRICRESLQDVLTIADSYLVGDFFLDKHDFILSAFFDDSSKAPIL